jgi:hypothetical protein
MPVLARPFSDLTGADPEKLQRWCSKSHYWRMI